MERKTSWPIDEFASFELKRNEKQEEFTIIMQGDLRFANLIAIKIDEIRVTKEEFDEYVE